MDINVDKKVHYLAFMAIHNKSKMQMYAVTDITQIVVSVQKTVIVKFRSALILYKILLKQEIEIF